MSRVSSESSTNKIKPEENISVPSMNSHSSRYNINAMVKGHKGKMHESKVQMRDMSSLNASNRD